MEEDGIGESAHNRSARLDFSPFCDKGLVQVNLLAQAIDFLSQYTTRTHAEIAAAVDRRIGLPGETLAYSTGKTRILELRERAKQALESRFDLREFHDRVLEYGSVPLPMLTDMIERWIESKRTQ